MDKKYLSIAGKGLLVILLVVFISSSLALAESQKTDKQKIVTRVAQDWVRVGTKQYQKGFYSQAQKSLLRALDYKKYLSVDDLNKINELLTKVKDASLNSSKVEESMSKGRQLLAEGKLLEAQACYKQAKSNPSLPENKLKYIEETLKDIDQKIKQRRKVLDKTYKDSVKFFEKEDYENARKGFLQVSGDDLFQVKKGDTPEQYLVKIDAILVQRTEFPALDEEQAKQEKAKVEENLLTEIAVPTENNDTAEKPVEVIGVIEVAKEDDPSAGDVKIEAVEVETIQVEKSKPKLTVKESYSRAVVKNAVDTAEKFTKEGRFYHAKNAVDKAYSVLEANKNVIGEEFYNKNKGQLKILTDMITAGRMDWLGETDDKTEQSSQ